MEQGHHDAVLLRQFYDQTTLHPLGISAVLVLGILLMLSPRRYAGWPLICMACFISPAQRVVVFGLNFTLLRLMIVCSTARVLSRHEYRGLKCGAMDVCLVLYLLAGCLVYGIQQASIAAVITQMGISYDTIGMYFTFRCLVRSMKDVQGLTLGVICVSVPVAAAFVVEHFTGRNMFAVLGGVAEMTWVRDGRLRCQGAFAHAILAGCFWAALLPLIAARWFDAEQSKVLTVVGIVCGVITIVMCASSTPVMAVLFAVGSASLFPMRRHMRVIRLCVLCGLVCLHLCMQKPVWHLLSRIRIIGGSTGDHRYRLINGAIEHFHEWWVLGTPSTEHWGYGLADVTNQYVLEGVRGGIITLMLFIGLLLLAFRNVNRIVRAHESAGNVAGACWAWAIGTVVFVHVTSFFAVSYFGQITMLTWLSLAVTASLAQRDALAQSSQGGGHSFSDSHVLGTATCRSAFSNSTLMGVGLRKSSSTNVNRIKNESTCDGRRGLHR